MALRKHVVLACALLAMCALVVGCTEETAAPEQVDEAPVLAPTNVRAIVISGGNVQVSWDPSSQPTVRGYNVYRLDQTDETIERVNPSLLEVTSIVDGGSRYGREYEYRVTSVGSGNRESTFASVMVENQLPRGKDGHPGESE
jgi:fibronectin type 3 domain-containing protein